MLLFCVRYGYVTPDDVPALLDEHIGKGKIIEKLWRGQMGLAEPDQKLSHQKRLEAISQTVIADRNNGCNSQPNGNSSKSFTCCLDNSNNTVTKETKVVVNSGIAPLIRGKEKIMLHKWQARRR